MKEHLKDLLFKLVMIDTRIENCEYQMRELKRKRRELKKLIEKEKRHELNAKSKSI